MPKLKKFRVDFISLLKEEEPANGKAVIYKSEGGSDFKFDFALKHLRKDAKQGLVYATVYEPGVTDTQGDWADQDQITDAAHQFLKEKRIDMVDVDHNYTKSGANVVESFIKSGPDPRFPLSKDGSWCVVIKVDPSAFDSFNGVSMAGGGQYDPSAVPPKKRTRKADAPPVGAPQVDAAPARLIQNLKDAGQWPANYDDNTDTDGDADDGVTMTDIFAAIQANCDDKGITMPNGAGVLDALAAKLADAPPDDDGTTVDPNTQKSVTNVPARIRPLKGDPRGTFIRSNSTH